VDPPRGLDFPPPGTGGGQEGGFPYKSGTAPCLGSPLLASPPEEQGHGASPPGIEIPVYRQAPLAGALQKHLWESRMGRPWVARISIPGGEPFLTSICSPADCRS
jgi:hypothetical protein